jgi:2,3-bisphosphoglycerate-dependent phosphoglycerate mutase
MKITAVRHCSAEGQEKDANLTPEGKRQAVELAHFLQPYHFDCVISSPFKRAIDSITPYTELIEAEVILDERLAERILSTTFDPDWDWRTNLERTYKEEHLKFPGGESTFEAKERIRSFIKDLESKSYESVLMVTHGNLLSLLLNMYQSSFGFKEWSLLSNPDVYLIEHPKGTVSKLWG